MKETGSLVWVNEGLSGLGEESKIWVGKGNNDRRNINNLQVVLL